MKATYRHTNIVAADWRALAGFYEDVFGCTPVPPSRDLSGAWLDRGTGVPDAHLTGIHLRLPGHGDRGPTLEIYGYSATEPGPPSPPTAKASPTSPSRWTTSPRRPGSCSSTAGAAWAT